jgi:putative ABC transport system permease protein
MESVANKLFGTEDPVGKVINIDNSYGKNDFKITGVVDDRLGKSHLHTNIFIVMNSGGMGGYTLTNNAWAGNNYAGSYVRLNPNADPSALEKKLPAFLNKYGADQLKNLGMTKTLKLQPIGTIHTTTGYENEPDKTVSSSFSIFYY